MKSSQRGRDAATITLGKTKSMNSDKLNNKITEDIIQKGKKLTLQVKEGGKVEKGMKIELNAAGYANSTRKAMDGVTYFGTDEVNPLSVLPERINISTVEGGEERLHVFSGRERVRAEAVQDLLRRGGGPVLPQGPWRRFRHLCSG